MGVTVGLFFAALFSAYVTVMHISTSGAILQGRGITLPSVLAVYLAGGIGAGLLYGVLVPVAKGPLGAYVVGWLVSVPLFVGVAVIHPRADLGERLTWVGVAVASALVGGVGGVIIWGGESK